jgi:hypothetical protein
MPNRLPLVAGLVIGLFTCPTASWAQWRTPIKIARVQVGLPAGPFSSEGDEEGGKRPLFKAGAWAPVWVELECQGKVDDPLEIVVETTDGDGLQVVGRVPLVPPMQPGERRLGTELSFIPYVKPGNLFGDIKVSVRSTSSQRDAAEPFKRNAYGLDATKYLILSVGSSLKGMWLPKSEGADPGDTGSERALRNGQVQLAEALEVGNLPDEWFGYQAVDLVMLTTGGDPKFWASLSKERRRLAALAEWVRRGGRLIVSAGNNADVLEALPEIKEMLPARVPPGAKRSVDELTLSWANKGRGINRQTLNDRAGRAKIAVVHATPRSDRGATGTLPYYEGNNPDPNRPLLVQGAYGLGRVTFVGFDLDQPALADWEPKLRGLFWEWLLDECGHQIPSGTEQSGGRFGESGGEDLYVAHLQEMLDSFEGVPVISFGWVALFILLYIALIGPIDYYFLKKVAKRMEWTWVTFPLIVIAVSAIAYFAAYALKGRDMKINKVDVVDVDLQSNRVYGQTSFTIFSPRIQSYTVGVEPAGPEAGDPAGKALWTPEPAAQSAANTTVSWGGRPNPNVRTMGFTRSYQYHSDPRFDDPSGINPLRFATGLEQVPIQVWSTKSFTANWAAKLDPNRPLVEHTLRHPPDQPDVIVGGITSHLPVEVLQDAWLLYRDKAIQLGQLIPGVERIVAPKQSDASIAQALAGNLGQETYNQGPGMYGPDGRRGYTTPLGTYKLWPMLFHEKTGGGSAPYNASTRNLDQSWRVGEQQRDLAVLVLRVPTAEDSAEAMSQKPQSATRLWLNALPGGETAREGLQGTLRQETYVRVFITIPAVDKK